MYEIFCTVCEIEYTSYDVGARCPHCHRGWDQVVRRIPHGSTRVAVAEGTTAAMIVAAKNERLASLNVELSRLADDASLSVFEINKRCADVITAYSTELYALQPNDPIAILAPHRVYEDGRFCGYHQHGKLPTYTQPRTVIGVGTTDWAYIKMIARYW